MIVSPQEYESLLYRLIDPNEFTHMFQIPENEPVYEIDLNTRKIAAPEFLSLETDHNSEIIWFKTDRFYDNFDLYESHCWIQYKNAEGKEFFYAAPIIIDKKEHTSEKILIPWAISKEVAAKTGLVEFSFQFFKLSNDKKKFLYVLNTQSEKSKILASLRIDPIKVLEHPENFNQETEHLADLVHRLTSAYEILSKDYNLYWIEVE